MNPHDPSTETELEPPTGRSEAASYDNSADGSEYPFDPSETAPEAVEETFEEPVDDVIVESAALPEAAGPQTATAPDGGSVVVDPRDPVDLPPLRAALEAVLLVVDEPVPEVMLAQVVERPTDEVVATLKELADEYTQQGRGFDLRNVSGGWRLYTRPECAPYVERFVLDGQQARLTQAALETLAVVAYRQPVTRGRISAIRGVNVDGVMRTLLTRGLVEEAGADGETGATLYRTTSYFLERLGLTSLEDLPPLAPHLPDAETLEADVDAPST